MTGGREWIPKERLLTDVRGFSCTCLGALPVTGRFGENLKAPTFPGPRRVSWLSEYSLRRLYDYVYTRMCYIFRTCEC